MNQSKSTAAFEEARKYIPGGVNSPVRSFRSVGGVPPFIAGGKGSKIYDIDGNEYIDYVWPAHLQGKGKRHCSAQIHRQVFRMHDLRPSTAPSP